jgi:hypothetical protein
LTQPTQYFCFSSAIQRLVYNSKLESFSHDDEEEEEELDLRVMFFYKKKEELS